MEREDLPTLRALGFKDDELKELGLWDVATGDPLTLAEAYIRRSKKKDTLATLREHLRDLCRKAREEQRKIRHVWFEQRSASKAYVRREEFESATGAVLNGKSKTLYVWRTDRLSRRGMGAVDRLIDDFEPRKARIVVTSEGLDSSQPGMRMVFGILADRAREEAKSIAERTKIGADAHKAEGRWPGGVTPYGLECPKGSGKLQHKPGEYLHSRYIAEELLKGTTPADITNALNERKIPTRHGKKWRAQTILNLAQSPSWAGLIPNRERAKDEFGNFIDKWYRTDQPLMGADGHPVSAGNGVVTFAEWQKIQAIIANRSRPGSAIGDRTRGIRKAATLMTGTLRCPHCKGRMGNGGKNYRCITRMNQGESVCIGVATLRERLDSAMEVMWVNHVLALPVDSETIFAIARRWYAYQDPAKEARKQAVLAALDNAAEREARLEKEFFIKGAMTEERFDSLRRELTAQIASLKAEVAELKKGNDLTPLMDPQALTMLWAGATVDERRALIQAALVSVTLLPPKGVGDRTPIRMRLVPKWRDNRDNRNIDAAFDSVERSRKRRLAEEAA
ncbi:recombinase family protein [Streptomyces kutzneri]|uniref:recombinase family protein n=1 Tax=Streptomyces kutzneri TaxID=3051179 RepID=UPI0028D23528|nr:recombinase family protein [Streptomyces sp. DSM 40907]